MATKTLITRIQNKIDELGSWKAVEESFKPLRGEICIVEVPSGDAEATTAPTCLIKIGNGTDFFKDLTYLSAPAADVYSWAKKSETEFKAWVKTLVTVGDLELGDYVLKADVEAVHAQVETNKTNIATLTTDLSALQTTHANDKTALEGAIATAKAAGDNAQSDLNAYKTSNNAAVAQALTDAKAYTDELKNGAVKTNTDNIGQNATAIATLRTDIQTGDSINDFKAVENALAGKQAAGDYATKADAQGYANAKDDAIADAKKAGTDAAAAVKALEEGTVADNVTAIAELKTDVENLGTTAGNTYETKTDAAQKLTDAKAYTDELANGQVKANKEAIEVLNGSGDGSVDKKISTAINAFATEVTDNGAIDKFAELVDYVGKHGGEAASMATAIDELEKLVGEKSVQTQISEAFTTANLDQYATDGDLSALAGTVSAMDTAYKAADTALGGRIDGVITRVGTLETEMDTAEGKIGALETKMETIENNAEKNIIETVKVNGVALTPDANRAVDVTVPTGALASKDKVSKDDLGQALQTELDAKATEADLTLAENRIAKNETDIAGLQTAVAGKAAASDLNDLTGRVNTAEGEIDTLQSEMDAVEAKAAANESAIGTLNTTVASKADQADLTSATNRITAIEDRIGFDGDILILNCGTSTVNV